MARAYSDLQTESLGNDFSSTSFPGTMVGTYVNEAVYRIARKVRIPALETTQSVSTVAGTTTFTLPSDDVRVLELYNVTDRSPLEEVKQQDLDDALAASGKPYAWARYAGSVALYPTPDAVYSLSLRYLKRTVFVNPSDTTTGVGYPDDYADLLVSWARHRMFRMEDDPEMASFWLGEFQRQLSEMQMDLGRQSERRRQLPSMWDVGTSQPSFVRR